MSKFSCEINSPQMGYLVLKAARRLLPGHYHLGVLFQHGQWYVSDPDSGALWSVYNGRGSGTAYGFGLELQENGDT